MSRRRVFIGAVAVATAMTGMMIAGTGGPAEAQAASASTVLPGSAVPFTSHAKALGDVAAAKRLSIEVWLTPRIAAAAAYAAEVSTPGNSLFRHYLSPDAYTTRFGATAAEAAKVEAWLHSQGFTGITTDAQRSYVRATATTSAIDAAFKVQLKVYKATKASNAGPYALFANDKAISVPASLAGSVTGVTGLDNAAPILPLDRLSTRSAQTSAAAAAGPTFPCSSYYGQHSVTGLLKQFGSTTFPSLVCGYTGGQIRAAYGANSVNTGKGQTIALVELGLTRDMFLTLQDYASANHLPAPASTRYEELSLGQGTACGDAFDVEEQLDVESSYVMAPGANQLVVGGDSCNNGDYGLEGLFNADTAILDGNGKFPLASVASNSWESGSESQPASATNIEHTYLVRAAAEGVGMYFSAGDGSGVLAPSSDPFVTAVGGTTLGIGSGGNRLFETGWSTAWSVKLGTTWYAFGEQGASGGGPSLLWKQPAYQKGVVPASLSTVAGNRSSGPVRSVPDISADADPFTGFAVGLLSFSSTGVPTGYSESSIGGTSLAAPLVAGMVTAAEQGQSRPVGFINPAVYKLARTSAFLDPLPLNSKSPVRDRGVGCDPYYCGALAETTFDDQSPLMGGYTGQVTLKGYDNMTGVGTPNGQNFINDLRRLEK